ncbi:MAG TPA: MBL fold metallo-hydrolase [Longimicrobiales bacterium]|nr:MBL fold metallo-hydrolase [Longimicrobiales bacterium]
MRRIGLAVLAVIACGGCTHGLDAVAADPAATLATTGGPSRSMIYARRTPAGVILVDLGWFDARAALRRRLASIGARPEDVVAVLVTHSHRDHVGGWRAVRGARFFAADGELELLHGRSEHGGWLARWGDRLWRPDLPEAGEIRVRTFASDTVLTFGWDTVHAFPVPGHTAGSAAYLIDGVLFLGDGLSHSRVFGGFRPPVGRYSEDPLRARRSLISVLRRARPLGVETVCTAHANCAPFDDTFLLDVSEP